MTSANVNLNYSFSSTQFENGDKENDEDRTQREATSSGGRDDDLFGKAERFYRPEDERR